jgi:hypothetical protein
MCIYTEISFSTHMWFAPYCNGMSNYLTFASRDRDMVATYTIPACLFGYHILRTVCRTMYTIRSTTYVEVRILYVMYKGHTQKGNHHIPGVEPSTNWCGSRRHTTSPLIHTPHLEYIFCLYTNRLLRSLPVAVTVLQASHTMPSPILLL